MPSPDSPSQAEGDAAAELAELRASVDSIDSAILHVLAVRFNITRQVSELKAQHSLPASDPRREAEHLNELRALATASGLEPSVLDPVFSLIYGRVVRSHQDVASSHQFDASLVAESLDHRETPSETRN
ncbi:chorismate mutase [Arthrobacter sp. NPDC080031]|uniref:chorismate mutase n=1 Tax=Arthrobacter sp. NPDC080031 TaxID=3155918 RepID=UPI00344E774D